MNDDEGAVLRELIRLEDQEGWLGRFSAQEIAAGIDLPPDRVRMAAEALKTTHRAISYFERTSSGLVELGGVTETGRGLAAGEDPRRRMPPRRLRRARRRGVGR